jgi:hypothetical protein
MAQKADLRYTPLCKDLSEATYLPIETKEGRELLGKIIEARIED